MQDLRVPSIAAICMVLLLAAFVHLSDTAAHTDGLLTVSFLDVGQGDAILIESPTGTRVLIDGGKDSTVLSALTDMLGFFVRDIDMVLATHADMDHIGGLIDVLAQFSVTTIVQTENESESNAFEAFRRAVINENATVVLARRGQVFDLGDGIHGSTTLTILFPDHDPTSLETNTASIVARLTYGNSSFLLTGDAPRAIEEHLVALDPHGLRSDVLKLGHHGSDTSTSDVFLESVDPQIAVISAGKDNDYGHPHTAVLSRLTERGIPYENTAHAGSIVFRSDGERIWIDLK